MEPILDQLHSDHINFAKLLAFLDKQQRLLQGNKDPDLDSIYDAIRYMKEYPDQVHHPLENAVFKYFLEHYEEAHDDVTRLLHEHDEMPLLTNQLLYILNAAISGVPQEKQKLNDCLKEYISIQKKHMDDEEENIYPILNSKLTKADWDRISSDLVTVSDPLFGKQVKKPYQELLQQLVV